MRLEKKVAVIAGAGCGNGMGRSFPEAFAMEGADLVLNYHKQPSGQMEDYIESLRSYGVKVFGLEGDISQEATARDLIGLAVKEFGRVDILLNTQGITGEALTEELSLEQWERMHAVHLTSMFLTCRYAVPIMKQQRYGRIINIASQTGQKGAVRLSHYASAKAGIIGFTKCLARETGAYNITVNCIAPGPIQTQMLDAASDSWKQDKLAELVLPRFGLLEEVTPTAIFLASEPDGNLYTGQTLGPNCGDVML